MASFSLLSSLLLLLLCCTSSFTSAQWQWDVTQVSIVAITSHGACTDVYPQALNCSLPTTLTFQLAGILPPNSTSFNTIFIFDGGDAETYARSSSLFNATTSTISATVLFGGYSIGLMGRLLSVYLFDYATRNRSAAFQGLSFVTLPPPVLTAISGCEGTGAATLNCVPDRDVLLFAGSGLSIFNDLYSFVLTIGNVSGTLYWNSGLQVLNDAQMRLQLNTSSAFILTPSHYTGQLMSLAFNLQWWSPASGASFNSYTNSLSISFAPLPAPMITAVISSGSPCIQRNDSSAPAFIGCVPEQSSVRFVGQYLYSATMALSLSGRGTYACETMPGYQPSSSQVTCFLPLIAEDVDGLAWDVTISTASGLLSYPGLVSFTSSTLITSLVPCNDYSQQGSNAVYFLNCAPGATLIIRGTRFPSDPALAVTLTGNVNEMTIPSNVPCWSPAYIDQTTLTCLIPLIDPAIALQFYGVTSSIQASFPTAGRVSNAVTNTYIVAFPNSPVLTSVSGCEVSNGSLVVAGCRGGDILTIRGSNLNGTRLSITFSALNLVQFACSVLDGWTAQQLQCRLPYVTPDNSGVQEGVLYRLLWLWYPRPTLSAVAVVRAYGNPFQVVFTWAAAASALSASSTSSNLTAVLVGVLVPVLVAMAVAVGLMWWRRRGMGKVSSPVSGEAREQRSAIELEDGASDSEARGGH